MQPIFSHRSLRFVTPLNLFLGALFIMAIVFSVARFAKATTPNPGHAFSEVDLNQTTHTTSATLTSTETVVLGDATAGAITLTLPTAAATSPRQVYFIKKIDTALANQVTIAANGAETIDGRANISLAQRGESVILQSDGISKWIIITRHDYDLSAYRAKGATLNEWFTSPYNGSILGTITPAANTMYAMPFIASKVMTIDQMAINVTTKLTGSSPDVGIYADNGNSYPGALIVDAGTQSGNPVGVKTYITGLPVTLDPGLYWLVYLTNTSPTIGSVPATSTLPVLGYASTLPLNPYTQWTVPFTFAALPATFTAGGTASIADLPGIFVRTSQ